MSKTVGVSSQCSTGKQPKTYKLFISGMFPFNTARSKLTMGNGK